MTTTLLGVDESGRSRDPAFPRLSDDQIAEVSRCAHAEVRRYRPGQELFRAGERDFKFFVIRSGEVEIIDTSLDVPRTVVVHGPGEFTGDISLLTGTAPVVSAVARSDVEVYEVSPEAVRHLLNRCPAVGDLILQAFIRRRQLLNQSGTIAPLQLIGSRYSQDTVRIREFLARNRVPFAWLDLENHAEVERLLRQFGLGPAETPVVILWGRTVLKNPSNRALAEAIGTCRPPESVVHDLAIVGAGPAGLAAAVYAASEGLRTAVLERTGPGGQAGSSMRIENYLGFPTGITGAELAERAVVQAYKFGAFVSVPARVTNLGFEGTYPVLGLEGGERVVAKCLLIAAGVDYRRLPVEGATKFEGRGIYYAATPTEAALCVGSDVVVVGGGNSAGQAAVYLSGVVRRVFLVVRAGALDKSMSAYLARRIEQTANIDVLLRTTVRRIVGNEWLEAVDVVSDVGQARTIRTPALFSFIGATPRTDWLPPEIERDPKGFVRTGPAIAEGTPAHAGRQPFLLETSRPGVFAAGDVRSGSVKRVASAVGEGAMAVQLVHEYLKGM